jgi:hypothetical protein
MQGADWRTAAIAAVVLMVLGVAAAFGWVAIYSHVIDPGQPFAVYQAYADKHAPWISVYAGIPLWFLGGWWIGRTRDKARAVDTAFGTAFVYSVLDLAIVAAVGGFAAVAPIMFLSLTSKAVAGAIGAWLSAR